MDKNKIIEAFCTEKNISKEDLVVFISTQEKKKHSLVELNKKTEGSYSYLLGKFFGNKLTPLGNILIK